MRVLFILKRQDLYGDYGYSVKWSGLYNSALLSAEMLTDELSIDSKLVLVTDNNDIDREVYQYKPNIVVIESIWVVPSKFPILTALHPKVTWIIRNHSALPFLAHEGNAVDWLLQCAPLSNVLLGHNDAKTLDAFNDLTGLEGLYLPNFYPTKDARRKPRFKDTETIHVGCFGAIRLLKNHLIQAVAAIRYANAHELNLVFHINNTRVEGGAGILRNLQGLFSAFPQHELRDHGWLDREEFLDLMRTMDVHMQVSMSETFNMVTADAVVNGVPVVVSKEIPWTLPEYQARTTDCRDIMGRLRVALTAKRNRGNLDNLRDRSDEAVAAWQNALTGI